jgi:hypothetical protein
MLGDIERVLEALNPDYSVRHEGAKDQWMRDPPE